MKNLIAFLYCLIILAAIIVTDVAMIILQPTGGVAGKLVIFVVFLNLASFFVIGMVVNANYRRETQEYITKRVIKHYLFDFLVYKQTKT